MNIGNTLRSARELLGDMYFEAGDFSRALKAYEADLERHPNRFNGLYGAGLALKKRAVPKMEINISSS
jgi:cytochrome c-type biogenesis protein CcmH/NrfG